LFDFDLITGEALFYKCGAAPSYVKRDNSIFRIRSETAPLGLMKTIDAEKIRVEVKSGDYIVMLSDGVSQSSDDAAWLIELLSKEPKLDMRDYAEYILEEAEKHSKNRDDMSVAVARVTHL
jgi:stage II sporulation protein E